MEQRSAERLAVRLIVDYEGVDDLLADYTENLSSGGTFIHTERVLAPETVLELVLSFPGLLQPLLVTGVVRWSRGGTQPGVGVELVRGELEKLAAFVDRLRRADRAPVAPVINVLVADDNKHVANLLCTGITTSARRLFGDGLAFAFSCADNGAAALELLHARRFDVAIIDVYLPVLDGARVIDGIRNTHELADLPIIAMSGGGDPARESALAAGANLFLDKPMRLRTVIASIRQLITA
jgi:uncharacterized protein (TIGR02266 family)